MLMYDGMKQKNHLKQTQGGFNVKFPKIFQGLFKIKARLHSES